MKCQIYLLNSHACQFCGYTKAQPFARHSKAAHSNQPCKRAKILPTHLINSSKKHNNFSKGSICAKLYHWCTITITSTSLGEHFVLTLIDYSWIIHALFFASSFSRFSFVLNFTILLIKLRGMGLSTGN